MKNVCIGIDISKDTLDYCIIDSGQKSVIEQGQFKNTKEAINSFLNKWGDDLLIAMEHTGHYGSLLVSILENKSLIYYLINPLELRFSKGVTRGKTDKVDAYRIALYCITNQYRIKPHKLRSKEIQQLKALMTSRDSFVKISTQLKNSLRANQILDKVVDLKELIEEYEIQISQIKRSIKKLEEQMFQICLLYTSPSPRDLSTSRMPSSA